MRPDTALITPIGKTAWIERAFSRAWESVASSSDGTKLVAVAPHGYIHVSANSGATWTWNGPQENWARVASSSNGDKLVTGVYGGPIYRSEDSGLSWTAVGDSYGYWASIASSSDGMDLAAVEADSGRIHRSRDSGQTWTKEGWPERCRAVALSADGTKLVATTDHSIYTWRPSRSVGSSTTRPMAG